LLRQEGRRITRTPDEEEVLRFVFFTYSHTLTRISRLLILLAILAYNLYSTTLGNVSVRVDITLE
jgi:hypothetical protein